MLNTRLRPTKYEVDNLGGRSRRKIDEEGGNEGAGEKERGRGTKARAGTTKDKNQEERSGLRWNGKRRTRKPSWGDRGRKN